MKEFVVLMASLTALVALSIDAMLPALGVMGRELGAAHPNDIQFVIGFLFIGMMIGQLIYGPVSDAIGRKPSLFIGLSLFIIGSLISWAAPSLPVMLAGRFIQGLGVSGPRILTMAIVRDRFHGRDMAQVMSLIMGVFIMVPAIAPSIGQVIIHAAGWREIFLFYVAATGAAGLWAFFRLQETLATENRRPLNIRALWNGLKEAACTRFTLGYTLASGVIFGTLLGYLNSTQQIFQEIFHAGDMFAAYFGMLALAIGAAFFTNSALVKRFGMRRITASALVAVIAAAAIFTAYVVLSPAPALWAFLTFASIAFFCLGLTFGNMGAMALEPMGHMAGLASAFMGAVSTAISLGAGIIIGQLYNGTLLPLSVGFLVLSVASFTVMVITERGVKNAFHSHTV